ncbi:N-acetylglucosamine-6-phosphate deacetylase [Candidatus Poribacteria bacterium]|nr:N-acetylglucosamine-6-phosphate deacetylase [Candidatus Poribacteria bacterium]
MDVVKGLKNGKILTPDGVIRNGVLKIDNGRIDSIGNCHDLDLPDGSDVIDANGNWILPGFIDIHCHGGMGCDTMDGELEDIQTIAKYHAGGGTTAFLATTASSSLEVILNALNTIHQAREMDIDGAAVIGAHLEGPFFSYAKRGCHLPAYVRNPRPIEYDRMMEYADSIYSMTLSPELDGAEGLIKTLVSNNIVASIGHSKADYKQVLKAIKLGASHVTHMYCAMSSIIKNGPARTMGVVESTLLRDELTTEVIADGKHLPPELIKLVIKTKGMDNVCIVTDAMRGAGMPPGVYTFGPKDGQEAVVQDGMAVMPDRTGYASSVVMMNDLVKVLIRDVELSLEDAVKMATSIPAKIIGVDEKMGSLEAGKDANIIVANDGIDVMNVVVKGRII